MDRRFAILDVFTDHPLTGNQLAVVFDCDGLDDAALQAIAREFNFPETVFIFPPENSMHAAKVRIFTPVSELPFAGHPTIGAAIALGMENGIKKAGSGILVLEEKIGPVRCGVRFDRSTAFAEFDLPVLAQSIPVGGSNSELARALGIEVREIGFENHQPVVMDGGLAFQLIPVRDMGVVRRVAPRMSEWTEVFNENTSKAAYVYCRDTINHKYHFHARMFAPGEGIPEDPATGSAVAALAGAIVDFDKPDDGTHTLTIEQGEEMGRPSLIVLEIEMYDGEFVGGRIGGNAVVFARGTIEI